MAKRTKSTLAKAQSRFMRAVRDFEKTVLDMVGASAKPKTKKAKKRRTAAKGKKARKAALAA